MADFFNQYISATTLTVTNLHSLGSGSFWQSAVTDNSTNEYEDAHVAVTVVTTTTAGSANGYIVVYGYASIDAGTTYTAGASGTEGSYTNTASRIEVARRITFPIKADETTARTFNCDPFPLSDFWGRLPERYGIIIRNETGTALASSGNLVKIQPIHSRSA